MTCSDVTKILYETGIPATSSQIVHAIRLGLLGEALTDGSGNRIYELRHVSRMRNTST